MQKSRALLCIPDAQVRNRLRQLLSGSNLFEDISYIPDLAKGIYDIPHKEPVQTVFIGSGFPLEQVAQFITRAKEIYETRDCAFILMVDNSVQSAQDLATALLGQGAVDGILKEPFSVDSLVVIVELSDRIRKERVDAREKLALSLLVREIGDQLDTLHALKAAGFGASIATKVFGETVSVLPELSDEAKERYFDILIEEFSQRLPSDKERFATGAYKGASVRIKDKMEAKIVQEHQSSTTSIHERVRAVR